MYKIIIVFFLLCFSSYLFACSNDAVKNNYMLAQTKNLSTKNTLGAHTEAFSLFYQLPQTPILQGHHFSVSFILCHLSGGNMMFVEHVDPNDIRLTAIMPAHGHGMNYQVSVNNGKSGILNAEGFLLHMPGEWVFIIDVLLDGNKQRFTFDYRL